MDDGGFCQVLKFKFINQKTSFDFDISVKLYKMYCLIGV